MHADVRQDLARYKRRVVDAIAAGATLGSDLPPLTTDAIDTLVFEDRTAHLDQIDIRVTFLKNVMAHSTLRLTYEQVSLPLACASTCSVSVSSTSPLLCGPAWVRAPVPDHSLAVFRRCRVCGRL
jgi:hypothetical protein